MRTAFHFLLLSTTLLACSTHDRGTQSGAPARPGAGLATARQTLDRLSEFALVAPRVIGLPLEGDGFRLAAKTPHGLSAMLPSHAGSPMRVAITDRIWIDIAASEDTAVEAAKLPEALVFKNARPDTDVVLSVRDDHVEELRLMWSRRAPSHLQYRIALGPGVLDVRVRYGLVEVIDENGATRLRSDPWFAVDATQRRIEIEPSVHGEGSTRILEAIVPTAGAMYPIAVDPGWGPPTNMAFARLAHTATALASGKVLVVGGESHGASVLSAAEIYDLTTRTWTLAPSMASPRKEHTATLLVSGKVLVTGGRSGAGPLDIVGSAEIYDPTNNTWTAAGTLGTERYGHAGALMKPSGKVLIAGGIGGLPSAGTLAVGEVWDPSTQTFAAIPGTISAHVNAVADAAGADRAIVIGGSGGGALADVYDAATNTWSSSPVMGVSRMEFAGALLNDGRLLVAGGRDSSSASLSSAEAFVPSAGAFSALIPMPGLKFGHVAVKLTTGKVLVAGGTKADTVDDTLTFLYDPATGRWTNSGVLSAMRIQAAIAPLPNGGALLTGGLVGAPGSGTLSSAAEVWADGLAIGQSCFATGHCASGFCYDGVCCDRVCKNQCESCNEAGSVGTCKLVTGTPRDPRPPCSGTAPCAGTCDGTLSDCSYPSSSTTCSPASCFGGNATLASFCDGAGTCPTPVAPSSCGLYGCGASSCKTSCASDADCLPSAYCASSACVLKKAQGQTCAANSACATGFCVDSVCCDATCTETCKSCNLAGSIGTCSAEVGCDAGVDAAIAEASVPEAGATPTVQGSYERCSKNTDCATGFCVEGVCCDSECKDRCHSCALLSNPGKCTLEPTGVDLKNECGAALSCVGTCGPGGQCIGAGNGTMCARNRCSGPSSGVGPAYCPGPGGTCATDEVVPFECSPYICEPAFGACSTTCSSSDDCARGFTCDVTSKTCVPPAPSEEDGGCNCRHGVGVPGTREQGSLLATLALVAIAATSRRRRATSHRRRVTSHQRRRRAPPSP